MQQKRSFWMFLKQARQRQGVFIVIRTNNIVNNRATLTRSYRYDVCSEAVYSDIQHMGYHAADMLHDVPPSHIILTPDRPVITLTSSMLNLKYSPTYVKMARSLIPSIGDFFAFDHHFDDMHREMSRMQQQMTRDLRHLRSAMNRLTPVMTLSDHASDLPLKQQLEQIRVPIVTEQDGTRRMKIQVDVSSFKPEEVSVTVKDDQVTINAKHDERSDTSHVYHEFSRTFTVPEGVDAETLMSSLSRDGVLTVTSAPLPAIEASKEKKLAIEMEN